MTVSRICQRDVDLVDLDESAWAAAERMHHRAVRSLVVLNADRQPIGIVTDRDLVVRVLAAEKLPRTTRVRDIMTLPVKTIDQTTSVSSAFSLMCGGKIHCLPVVDGSGRLVGMLTLDDVLAHLTRVCHDIGRILDQRTPHTVATPPSE